MTKNADGKNVYENNANAFKVNIAQNVKEKKLISIKRDGYELAWGLNTTKGKNINDSIAQYTPVDEEKALAGLSNNEKKKTLTKLTSTINYASIKDGVDLQYILESQKLKENIILNQYTNDASISFMLYTTNMTPILGNDNSIVFYDNKDNGKEVMKMQAPFMTDAKRQESDAIKMTLQKAEGGYVITLQPDSGWLTAKERAYPVVIDPPVDIIIDNSYIEDTQVTSAYPDNNYGSQSLLSTGYDNYYPTVSRSFVKFNLPALTSSDMVVGANLSLTSFASYAAYEIDAHVVTSDWDENTVTWYTTPSYNFKVEDYFNQAVNSDSTCSWDITSAVKSWYNSTPNYGIMLKGNDESSSGIFYYLFSTESNPTTRPVVSIQYVNYSGLEDFWTYHSQSAGRAGTGYTNDYNGNVVFIHDDFTGTGSRAPIELKHVFNSNEKNTDIGFGSGWRLNYSQTITTQVIGSTTYYIYTDKDGTKHYFNGASDTWDMSGLNIKLTRNPDNTYTLKDKQDNTVQFNAGGYLVSITDNHNNQTSLNYGTYTDKPDSITDGIGRSVCLYYDTNGHLNWIEDFNGDTCSSFEYTSNRLSGILHKDMNTVSYSYDANENMTNATSYDGYRVTYDYWTGSATRVKQVLENNTDSTLGSEINISYSYNTTVFTDQRGKINTYLFNDNGNTVCVKDNDGQAQFSEYATGDTVMNNKLTMSSNLQKTVVNLLKNHNAETANTDWTAANWTGSTGSCSFATDQKAMGSRSLKVTKTNTTSRHYYYQAVTVEKGKTYTFSADLNTSTTNANGKGALIFVSYKDSSGTSVYASSKYVGGTVTLWPRLDVTFTLPANSTSTTIAVAVGVDGETGSAWFDDLQLEEGDMPNSYNLVENSDFANGLTKWTKSASCDTYDTVVTSTDTNYPGNLDKNCFKVYGDATLNKEIHQTINIGGASGDVYTFSGWGRGESVNIANPRYFAIDIGLHRTDGSWQWKPLNFNEDSTQWQYASTQVMAEAAYDYMVIYYLYYNNVNAASFDGMQLVKERIGDFSAYDSNGNPSTQTNSIGNTSSDEYNSNNDLDESATAQNPSDPTTYTYNTSAPTEHELTSSESAEGVQTAFTYDAYGNVTSNKTGNSTTYVQSSTEYTGDYCNSSYPVKEIDPSGNETEYFRDRNTQLVNAVDDGKNNRTNYTYDNMDRLLSVYKTIDGSTVTNSYTYLNDMLQTITHNGFTYTFNYDSLKRNTSILVGTQTLLTNNIQQRTGLLNYTMFGNNQKVGFTYDIFDRVSEKKYNDVTRFQYKYDSKGRLGYLNDLVNSVVYKYTYDNDSKLTKVSDSNGNNARYDYDANGNVADFVDVWTGGSYRTDYTYDKDDREKTVSYKRNTTVNNRWTNNYDVANRLYSRVFDRDGTTKYTVNYSYTAGSGGSSTNLISRINNNGTYTDYTYDANNNISTITRGGQVITYFYNEADEVVRENNQVQNKTILYAYDAGGNLTTKTEYAYTTGTPGTPTKTYNYVYGNSNWNDLLTSFDGKDITYDSIGNPLTYDGWTYSWEEGRQLSSMSKTGTNASFLYNSDGMRTRKTVNSITTNYILYGNKITKQSNGTDTLYFTYDTSDNLVSMNLNGTEYFYIRNAQGDITGLFDINGTQVVSYTYDTWGKLISTTGTLASTLGVKNPFRYRGYYYDTETGLYYLQSRYYDPNIGRFINADDANTLALAQGELLGANLFAYCNNNPVMNSDPSGMFRISIFAAGLLIDSLLILVPYLMSLFTSVRAFSFAAKFSIFARKMIGKLTKLISKGIVGIIREVTYKFAGHVAQAAAEAFLRKGIEGIVGSVLSLSPGVMIATIISLFGKEPWKAISF